MLVNGTVVNTYAWSLVSGDGMPATPSTTNTLQVSPSQTSVYQVTVTAPNLCASVGTTITVTVPTAVSWTGAAGDGAWANPANWNPCVPTRVSTATIPNGLATPYPVVSTAVEVGGIVQHGPLTLSGGNLSLYGNHTGAGAFTQSGGTFVAAGTGAQNLRGLAYGAFSINGTGIKTLQGNASASGAVTLSNGLLQTGPSLLTLTATAALSETATSYILGRVAASATVASGSSSSFNGLGATIAAPSNTVAPGFIQAVRTTGTAITSSSLPGGRSIGRSYDLTPAINTGLNLNLTLAYNTDDLNGLPENLLFLYRAVDAGSPFSRFSNATLNTSSKQIAATAVNHLSIWTMAASSAPLPVELSAFSVAAAGPDAHLSWTTALEKNNDYFEVQASTNGFEFVPLGRVASRGPSTGAQGYAWTDAKIARYRTSRIYYRLRQVDTDGTVTFSPVKLLSVAEGTAPAFAVLLPNPSNANDAAPRLLLASPAESLTTLILRDAMGRVLSQRQVSALGKDEVSLTEAGKLAAGLYLLEVQQAAQHVTLKLLRE